MTMKLRKQELTRYIYKTRNIVTKANLIITSTNKPSVKEPSKVILYWGSSMLYRINKHYNNLQIHCFGNPITLKKNLITLYGIQYKSEFDSWSSSKYK